MTRRTDKLNSILREVISDVIRKEVKNPDVDELFTVTRVDITKDLQHAKVYISVIGDEKKKDKTLQALQSAASFIAIKSSKQVVMRYFPELTFILDDSSEKHARIEELLKEIEVEREERNQSADPQSETL